MTETLHLPTPDGRSLDVWLAGPADGQPLICHGHLTLVVDTFPGILDELIGSPA